MGKDKKKPIMPVAAETIEKMKQQQAAWEQAMCAVPKNVLKNIAENAERRMVDLYEFDKRCIEADRRGDPHRFDGPFPSILGEEKFKPGMMTYDLGDVPAFDKTKVYLIKPSIDHPIVPGQPVPMSNVIELHNVKVTPSVFIEPEMVAPKVEVPKEPFSISVNVKHYFSKADKKMLRRRFFKKVRLPRKLKKAYRKMTIRDMEPKVELGGGKNGNDVKITMSSYLGMKHGYKRTKWVNKAFCHFKKMHKAWEERTTKQMQEYMKQQAAEMVVTKEQQERLAEMLRKK